MAFSIKFLKKRFMNYAFSQVAEGTDIQHRLQLLLVVITPEAFSDFNIYAFPNRQIKVFSPNIESTANIVKDIALRVEQKESLISVFDSFDLREIDVHLFFTDAEGCYVDNQPYIVSIIESLTFLSKYLNESEDDKDISLRRNQAIIKSNLDAFIDFIESLYLLQKDIT